MTKPCGHPPHPEDGNIGVIKPGAVNILNGPTVEAHREDPQWFVGKHVKLGFEASNDPQKRKEYMWVSVSGLHEKELIGTLANTPIVVTEYSHGDQVAFDTSEILDVT